jgi:lipopolysaccharide export system permease protein
MAPMAVLAASVLSFSMMSKDREVLALMTGGVSAFRISLPLLGGAVLVSGLAFLDSEYLMPPAYKTAENIYRHQVKKQTDTSFLRQDKLWIKTANEDMWNIGFVDLKNKLLFDVSVLRFSPDMRGFAMIIFAGKAFKSGQNGWIFLDGTERKFDKNGEITESAFQRRSYDLTLDFGELKQAAKVPQEMNFAEITAYIKRIKTAGYNDIRYTVDRYIKISFPLISLVMAFLAIPFGLHTGGRSSGALSGITLTVIIGFIFWFFFSMGVSMGHSGKLPPLVSATGAHLLFMFGSLYLLLSKSRSSG